MKLLLVNSNPVVSRLTALSARKESVELDEIKNISELKNSDYNIIFVDSESYTEELANILKNSGIDRRVLFYTQDEEERPELFNFSILKPFLPSEVSAILRETKLELDNKKDSIEKQHLNLDELISDKKDDLEPINIMDSEVAEPKIKVKEPQEEKKDIIDFEVEELPVIKEIENKEIEELETSIEKRDEKKDVKEEIIDNELFELNGSNKNSKNIDNELFSLDGDDSSDNRDDVLDIDTESSKELDLDSIDKELQEESSDSTKILDKDEISNIKNLLDDNPTIDENMSLDDFMTNTAPVNENPELNVKSEKLYDKPKKIKKKKKSKKASTEVIIESLGSLPVDELRRLLLGAKVSIKIKFPKE